MNYSYSKDRFNKNVCLYFLYRSDEDSLVVFRTTVFMGTLHHYLSVEDTTKILNIRRIDIDE